MGSVAVDARCLGVGLTQELSVYLRGFDPDTLVDMLTAETTFNELLSEKRTDVSLVLSMHYGADFVIEQLPNVVFTRDSSIWVGLRGGDPVADIVGAGSRGLVYRLDLWLAIGASPTCGKPTSRGPLSSKVVKFCCSLPDVIAVRDR